MGQNKAGAGGRGKPLLRVIHFANVRRKVEKLSVKIEENEKRLADQAKGKSKDTAELDNVREELDKAYVSLCL